MTIHDCTWVEEHLDAWLEGELDATECLRLETEAASCERCAKDLAATAKLRAAVAMLPVEIAPSRDLWPAIDRQLPRRRFGIPLFAAAAVALALVGGRVLYAPPPPLPVEHAWRDELTTANATFRQALDASPDLDPEVRAIIEKNFADIDRAIAEIETALEKNPSSPMLQKALVAMEQQRLDVLRQLTLSSQAG
jgi:hypothetical protein